jgi:F-type H+-transporting ATPase subunit b
MIRIARVSLLFLAMLAFAGRPALAVDEHGAAKPEHDTAAAKTEGAAPHHDGPEASLLRGPSEGFITGLTTLIVFLGLVVILGKFAWGPISKGLEARENKIRRDIEEAEAARARAEATMKEYQAQLATAEAKVRELLSKATSDAEQIATNVRTRAQQEAQEIKESATKEIDSARRDAVQQVHQHAAMLATNVAEKILRRNLNADDQRDLVETSLNQLQTIKA